VAGMSRVWSAPAERSGEGALESADSSALSKAASSRRTPKGRFAQTVMQTLLCGALFSIAFAIVLTPWTIRNWRVFHLFQPLSPAHAEMPGEFVPRGYGLWLRTWLDDDSYIAPLLWSLDTDPIDFEDIPPYAFDSAEEKNRVAALIDKYNHPDGEPAAADSSQAEAPAAPQPSPSAANANTAPSPKKSPANSNANSEEEEDSEEGDEESDKEQQG